MALARGAKLGPYEIQSPLGAGGMGEVYRATDTKLGRDIALKVLPAEMAQDADRLVRFRREAKALAQLDHPNIVTIHSVEECDGIHFLTMQLVEGLPLDRLIPQGGLPVEQIVEIAGALGDALAAAHEKGIVHRDLKPANVMVSSEGRVTVLDFGLAKDIRTANFDDATMTSASRTEVGVVMGTPAYMSPEQASGRPLDHRTDIFSLGVVLHEMATGQRPFEGSSSAELVSAILRDTPPSVTDARPDLPSDLARVIRRCLEKDPRHRVQTARDVSNEFRDLSRQASRTPIPSSTSRAVAKADSGSIRADEGFWVAVLPFKHKGTDSSLEALAEGITEEIITGLSRFSYLRVIARGSSAKYLSESGDARTVGKELGARYVMEGSLRQAGTRLRLTVQLVDAVSGAHLWAETYDRALTAEKIFELQDDLVPRVVSTVADTHGVLPYSMSQTLRNRNPDELTAYEALLRGFAYFKHVNPEDHAGARAALEKAVKQEPGNADCWAMLSMLYREENNHGFNVRPDPVGRALAAARRAVDTAPSNHLAHHALASVLFFRRETVAFRSAAQRAIELNPMDGFTIGYMGFLISYSGDWERGCALMEQARDLNPNHPGWYWFPPFFNAYRKGDYPAALEFALKVNMPGFWRNELALAATYGQLGELELASDAARELLAVRPGFDAVAREECAKWWQPDLVEQIIDGLRKAGLEIAAEGKPAAVAVKSERTPIRDSGASRAEEGFWVAVLTFKFAGANAELKGLADGLSEEIVTGLSRFSYLRVIARGSTAKYSSESVDVRSAGKELGARYVMEGSLRQAGTKLRLAVQLVDATSGAHLWAENFERIFSPETVFELQDDLVPRIVSTVADMAGVLPRSISEGLRSRPPEQLSPYEAVLRSFAYFERYNPEELAAARSGLEAAVRKAPAYADAWAMLSYLCGQDYVHGYDLQANALETAASAARRAVELGPSNHLAYFSLAQSLSYQKDFDSFRDAAERAVELNPMDGNSVALLGELLTYAGSTERGMQLAERAKRLNPNHSGGYWYADFYHAFCQGDYRGALGFALKVKLRGNPLAPMFIAAACGQLGEADQGWKAVRDLLKFRPELPSLMRKQVAKIWNPEYSERFLQGLRKAGLEIPEKGASDANPAISGSLRKLESGAARTDQGFWVAVLPFKYAGTSAELKALADGLSEEIVTGLSRFSYLRVIARGSTAKYSSESVDVRSAGKELGARYVMEGSLRQAGTKLRLAVQLVDATSGAHLWAENFERTFSPETVFELQDDLVPRIVSTVADHYGVLAHSMSESLRGKGPDQLSPYEAVLRSFGYYERLAPDEHALVRFGLERAVQQLPNYADAWAMLSIIYGEEYKYGFNAQPHPLDRALEAARRAIDAEPSNHFAYLALAPALFFRKEFQAFRSAAERVLTLNPMDSGTIAYMGILMSFAGDWERGRALVERAMQLNPKHPGWYWFAPFYDAYRKRDYRGALDVGLKINMPGLYSTHVATAAAYGQLGERDAAGKALRELLVLWPDFAESARAELEKWFDPELIEHVLDGLRKAGLQISPEKGAPALVSSNPSAPISGAIRAEDGFWVAVLPFKYSGGNADLTALTEGLTEEIVTGLSRFSYLRVISRGSTAKYSSESGDARAIGKELGARYVMEGSLRQAGTKLRLAVQLVDATTGAHLWAENFERTFSPETVFELQDDLVPRIVSTVADMYGVLARSMSEAIRGKADEELTPHEAVLRAFGYMERVTPQEHARVRRILERAVSIAPNQSDAWAMLANLYWEEHAHGLNPQPDPLGRALAAARRAVDAAPTNNLAHYAVACTLFFQKDFMAFRSAAERAIALNRMDASVAALIGNLIAYAGDWERGCAVVESAMQLNPHHPGWYWFVHFNDAYRRRDYRGALGSAIKINQPGNFYTHAVIASAYGQLGMHDEARKALQELFALRPDFAKTVREEYGRWFHDLAFIEHQLDGLRKAGLEIAPEEESAAFPAHGNSPHSEAKLESGAVRADQGFWVAVLPFKFAGANAELKGLADGLSEEIVTGLSRFSYLRVIARGSTAKYSSESGDVRAIGKELGARYVMEGSLRQAGTKLRLAVQLADAATGAHLWAENYERVFSPEAVFELQDELVPRIVSTVADMNGVLPRSMSETVRSRTPEELSPYEAVLRSFGYFERVSAEELAAARSGLELAVRKAPAYADAWALLALLCVQEHAQGFNLQADSLTSGATAARRAVEAAPSNALAYFSLAQALFFQKEFQSFRNAAERAVALNPMDGNSIAFLGELLTYAGDLERGLALAGRAKQLNPSHPGWYWYVDSYIAYRQGDYRAALNFILKANLPGHWGTQVGLAVAYAQLGERDAAAKAVQALLKLRPDFAATLGRDFEMWWGPEYREHLIDGLRKAGLQVPGEQSSAAAKPAAKTAGNAASVTPSIAVLPFANISADKDQEYFSDGLAEEIINLLAHVSGLKVIARTSAFAFRGKEQDIRGIAEALGVGNVLQGSVRRAGSRLRVTAQLINAADGAHLWSERYDREMTDVFAIQDEISAAIAEHLKVHFIGIKRQTTNVAAYEAFLEGRHHWLRFSPEGITRAFECYQKGIALDPSYAPAHVGIAEYYMAGAVLGLLEPGECIAKMDTSARRALELDDTLADAYGMLAHVAAFQYRWAEAKRYFLRAMELGFGSAHTAHPYTVWYLLPHGQLTEALAVTERALARDPLSAVNRFSMSKTLAFLGKSDEALEWARKTVDHNPNYLSGLVWLAEILAANRQSEQAIAAAGQLTQTFGRGPWILLALGSVHALAGHVDEAHRILEELTPPASVKKVLPSINATIHAQLAENDAAFAWADKAMEQHDPVLILYITYWKTLKACNPVCSDPRYAALLKKMNLAS